MPAHFKAGGGNFAARVKAINAGWYLRITGESPGRYGKVTTGHNAPITKGYHYCGNCGKLLGKLKEWARGTRVTAEAALKSADDLITELKGGGMARPASLAPTMGNLKKVSYTHEALIELIIENPTMDQNHLAAHFGYTPGWISNILASEAFQARMASRREEIIDPRLKASMKELFEGLARQSLEVLHKKLSQEQVSENVAIRCAELGAKALGIGGHAPPAPTTPAADRLARLAERLVTLLPSKSERIINGEVTVLEAEIIGTNGKEASGSGPVQGSQPGGNGTGEGGGEPRAL